jgi:hypothetical protein
MCPATASPPA